MDFYFCVKYIYTGGDEKEMERDMYAALSYFRESHVAYEKWKNNLEEIFSYLALKSEPKYYYV